jgi:queuine tRNA-ribosyltransferase
MTLLMRPEPFAQEFDRLFSSLFSNSTRGMGSAQRWVPAMDLVEAEDYFVLKADLPGLAEEDVAIEVQDNVLTISGSRQADHERAEQGWFRLERSYGAFNRSLTRRTGSTPTRSRRASTAASSRCASPSPRSASRAGSRSAAPRTGPATGRSRAPPRRSGPQIGCGLMSQHFTIDARDGSARAGVLRTAHGDVRTPAFVPLASTGTVKSLQAREVAELGYEMVLGNTFHLFIQPGHEHVERMGGLHEFMGWDGAIVTDSGGFQVFSMGHGSVAEEVKRRAPERREASHGGVISIEEEGVRFRSYLDGGERFMGPETSMEVQAALGSDVALAFDECTPFNVSRDYTARSTERTHRWLDRCVAWHERNAPEWQLFFGIVQGGVHEDLRRESAERVTSAAIDGVAIGGSLGRDKDEMRAVVELTAPLLPDPLPRHLLGVGDVDDLVHGVGAGIDMFDCATPTRLARHGTALVPDRSARWRVDLSKAAHAESRDPLAAGCPCPACADHTRGYIHYLIRARELTAVRLLTMHNLTFMSLLMERLRAAVADGAYENEAERLLEAGPYEI